LGKEPFVKFMLAGAAALLFGAPAFAAPAAPGAPPTSHPVAPPASAPALPLPAAPLAPLPPLQSEEEALRQDAGEYAARYGVGLDEAMRRLRAQEESLAETDRLQRVHARRLAGLFIEHRPDYRIVVLLTGSKRVRDRAILAGGKTVPVVFRTGARASREELLKALGRHAGKVRSLLPGAQGMGLDPRTGELVLMVRPEQARRYGVDAMEKRLEAVTGVPGRIRIIDEADRDFGIEGGARVEGIDTVSGRRNFCTTGFVVTDGARSGVLTAAHCPDALTYHDPAGGRSELPFIGQWGWSFQDVQVNASEAARQPWFYADPKQRAIRALTGARGRAATRAGDLVCHRGERSGYSCAEVELTEYAPPGDLCGGPCAPVWVTVAGPSCGGGDSGGPVFRGTVAYGIVKGGTYRPSGGCAFYYYMSVDYLPDGWSLVRAEPEPPRIGTPPDRADISSSD
jgi:hypothetical protein